MVNLKQFKPELLDTQRYVNYDKNGSFSLSGTHIANRWGGFCPRWIMT